jgi:hypothetical protein
MQTEHDRDDRAVHELKHWFNQAKHHYLGSEISCPEESEWVTRMLYLPDYKEQGYPDSKNFVIRQFETAVTIKQEWLSDNLELLCKSLRINHAQAQVEPYTTKLPALYDLSIILFAQHGDFTMNSFMKQYAHLSAPEI